MFKLDNFCVILFVSFSYKKLLQCSFYENLKNRFKNSKTFVYYNEHMNANSNFKRNYLENFNDLEGVVKTKSTPFFMNFSNINKKLATFSHWTAESQVSERSALGLPI